jgi:parallel beta-helix repeat protein
MHPLRHLAATLLLLAGLIAMPGTVRAETYDTCAGFIDSLPATISTQGTWCLRQNLATGITSGNAITVATNNVTIDCNDFKVGGLAAGVSTTAVGVYSVNQLNTTIRNCTIRGFKHGIRLDGSGAGHLVENNRLDNNTFNGIFVRGDSSIVRRNLIVDTGGIPDSFGLHAIYTYYDVDVLDNTINNVVATNGSSDTVVGIYSISNNTGTISGNRVRGLASDAPFAYLTRAIVVSPQTSRVTVRGNDLYGPGDGTGVSCPSYPGSTVVVRDNVINGFATGIGYCSNGGGNNVIDAP